MVQPSTAISVAETAVALTFDINNAVANKPAQIFFTID